MHQAHERCHICKKVSPDRFIYYKDYNELEGKRLCRTKRVHYLPDSVAL